MSQQALAALLDCSQTTISDWEMAKYVPEAPMLYHIAHRLNVDPAWLATGEGDRKPTLAAEGSAPYHVDPARTADKFKQMKALARQTGFSDQMQSELLSIFSNLTPAGQHEALAMLHRLAQKDQQMRIELTGDQYNSMVRHTGDTQHRGSVAVSSGGKKKKTGKRKPA